MTRMVLGASFILFIGLALEGPGAAQDITRLQTGVVKITAKPPEGTANVGTGFIVRVEKEAVYIVTAAHVVVGDQQPRVEFFTKRNLPIPAEVLGLEGGDEVRGLALLVVRGAPNLPTGLTALSLAGTARLTGGEDIVVIGFPRNAGPWAIVKGNISSRQGRDLFFSPSVESGHSGGPIFQSGKVVGVVGAGSQTVGRGVTVGSVEDYLDGFGVIPQAGTGSSSSVASVSPAPVPPTAQAKSESRPPTNEREITGKDGAPMAFIPAGSFLMGSTEGEVDRGIQTCVEATTDKILGQQICERLVKAELPQHKVLIDAFYLDKHEVTNRLFQRFVQQTGYQTTVEQEGIAWTLMELVKGANWQKPEAGATVFESNRAQHPVVAVSWDDAVAYCRWAGQRLPTEAEFEYALRAGTTTKYWWGGGYPGARRAENIGDESAKHQLKHIMPGYTDGAVRTAPVGSYEANPWGLYDIGGNVAEWAADWYDDRYYYKSPERNPKGPSSGQYRVIRGGSWDGGPGSVRTAYRSGSTPTSGDASIGFRCAQDVSK